MPKDVQVINRPPQWNYHMKKVGVYCRVSSNSHAQLHSLADQASGLSRFVHKQPFMEVADIFIDVARGSNAVDRQEFQRMIKSAHDGKIEYVVTKAVSRLGRSTEDVLIAIRALQEYGVEVYFEDQKFGSLNPEAELMISLYCGVAEGENKSHSDNVRWGLKRHAENGTSKLYNKPCYGYRQNDDGDLEIVENEAAVVRRVYAMYLSGMSIVKIKAALEEDGIPSPTGKDRWSKHTLEFMLTNTKYYGTAVIFKTHTPEYKAKRKVNDGEVSSYAAEGNNEPIIPEEMFNRVQEERTRRSNIEVGEDGVKRRRSTKYSAKKPE
ncbi:recombinase family protein [Acetanaerobacterium elongatum]|uniref:Site-specific DNA recombinase n=1 Tax=Acetanaerobacterium elongatum TaxID=258515 RepID=A0A1G9Y3Z2_9FIRM|nr:recombinase family protein [Acetanaerobacterium elongatum]SDN03768.1 Site-specific DNA recombinase [Acetanaerobacterium elongatum]